VIRTSATTLLVFQNIQERIDSKKILPRQAAFVTVTGRSKNPPSGKTAVYLSVLDFAPQRNIGLKKIGAMLMISLPILAV